MSDQDHKLWDEITRNPAATLALVRNATKLYADGAVEPFGTDIPTIERFAAADKPAAPAVTESKWELMVIESERSMSDIVSIGFGTLDEMLDIDLINSKIAQDNLDMAENIRADLSRLGARYSEFIGGTVVLASRD